MGKTKVWTKTVTLIGSQATPQGQEGRTMFFRVGEETDQPAQEGR